MNAQITNGQGGCYNLIGPSTWTRESASAPSVRYIQAITDVEIDTAEDGSIPQTQDPVHPSLESQTLPAGIVIEGRFTEISVTTGFLRLYF